MVFCLAKTSCGEGELVLVILGEKAHCHPILDLLTNSIRVTMPGGTWNHQQLTVGSQMSQSED